MVSLSDEEAEMIRAAAAKQNMAVGAWIGEVAVRASDGVTGIPGEPGVMLLTDEMRMLLQSHIEFSMQRVALRAIGNNLNQLVRHANSTGTVHVATAQVLERISVLAERSEELMKLFLDSGAATRVQLLAARRRKRRAAVASTDGDETDEWDQE